MTTWIIKSETNDLNSALDIIKIQRNRGYKAWIEDQNGRNVDEETLKNNATQRTTRETVLEVLIWGTAAAVAIGGLYACSLLAGD